MPKKLSSAAFKISPQPVRFFTVGPSQIYSTVPSHMENAIKEDVLSLSHRGSEFKEIYKRMDRGLRKLLKIPPEYEIVVLSSALEAMERVTQSMSHNNTFHILTGFFGKGWMGIAKDLAKSPEFFQYFDWDKNKISKTQFEDIKIPKKSELVCITQNDTSVGFAIPMEKIYALKKKYPDKLFALDVVSSIPYVDINYQYLDAVFFSIQKGFGLPAGLSILILSPDAIKKAKELSSVRNYSIGSYHNILKLAEKSRQYQTNETPNVLGIYLLSCIVEDFLKIGISNLRSRLDKQAQMIYSFFTRPENYKDTQNIGESFVKLKEYQSITTPVLEIHKGSDKLRNFTAEKGLILGAGYSEFKNKHIRIGNFPALQERDFKKLIKVLKFFS